ncbi:Cupin 1 [Cinnamomum micranthum f. kanehirae]|uniref:Cupin 1 n=1 Tax=Cinnamomum micranthum f. kanehirae TaxID=337451 RepID=A0A3S4P3Z5_9MAGN|nr:Cupin 1 [Cinnamomum micranthum f. kanehirae]
MANKLLASLSFSSSHCFLGFLQKHQTGSNWRREHPRKASNRVITIFFDEKEAQDSLKTREGNLRFLTGLHRRKATITLMRKENKESYNLRKGDILRVEAGTTHYIINRHNKEQLLIANSWKQCRFRTKFSHSLASEVATPNLTIRASARDILEAAFNTEDEKVRKVFQENQRGGLRKCSTGENKADSPTSIVVFRGGTYSWRKGGEDPSTYSKSTPTYSNQHGQIYEVDSSDYSALQAQDISVAYAIIRGVKLLITACKKTGDNGDESHQAEPRRSVLNNKQHGTKLTEPSLDFSSVLQGSRLALIQLDLWPTLDLQQPHPYQLTNPEECPPELLEAIASIIFAAPRCSDLPELIQIRNLFTMKYGKEFVSAASELRPDSSVNRAWAGFEFRLGPDSSQAGTAGLAETECWARK